MLTTLGPYDDDFPGPPMPSAGPGSVWALMDCNRSNKLYAGNIANDLPYVCYLLIVGHNHLIPVSLFVLNAQWDGDAHRSIMRAQVEDCGSFFGRQVVMYVYLKPVCMLLTINLSNLYLDMLFQRSGEYVNLSRMDPNTFVAHAYKTKSDMFGRKLGFNGSDVTPLCCILATTTVSFLCTPHQKGHVVVHGIFLRLSFNRRCWPTSLLEECTASLVQLQDPSALFLRQRITLHILRVPIRPTLRRSRSGLAILSPVSSPTFWSFSADNLHSSWGPQACSTTPAQYHYVASRSFEAARDSRIPYEVNIPGKGRSL